MKNINNKNNILQQIAWSMAVLFLMGVFIIPKSINDKIIIPSVNKKISELVVKFKGIEKVLVIKLADKNDLEKILLSYKKNLAITYISFSF